jgi:Ca-activated chloride channel family protein
MKTVLVAVLALVATGASWVDPHATAREASRLYAAGKFGDAAAKYKEALIDDPDSVLLHYNAAAAAYRDGKYDDAIAALRQIPQSDVDPARTAQVAYNLGNATYRLGAATEGSNPQQALQRYAEALAAYRRAMGVDPADQDAKLNYELVQRKLAELQKKLEEQKQKQQDQQKQQQDQQQQDPQKQQNDQEQQQGQQERQQGDQQEQQQAQQPEQHQGEQPDQQQAQQQQQDQPQPEAGQQPQDQQGGEQQQAEQKAAGGNTDDTAADEHQQQPGARDGDVVAGDRQQDDLPRRDAEALLDAQRDQEVRPDEIVRKLQGARVAEPREDW